MTKILHGSQKGFCGGSDGLRVWWISVMPLGPGPGQPTCSVMVVSRTIEPSGVTVFGR